MSRIIVKNLPDSVTKKKLQEIFSEKGQVTDVQLKYDMQGKFRHFGFVGFKTEEEAEVALKYFNNTFVGFCKIQVERCLNLGDSTKHRDGNKTLTAVPKVLTNEKEMKEKAPGESPEDPEFEEFRKIHSKGIADKIWDNDVSAGLPNGKLLQSEHSGSDGTQLENNIAHKKDLSDFEYLKSKVVNKGEEEITFSTSEITKSEKLKEEFFHVKVTGFGSKIKKKDIKLFFSPLKLDALRIPPKTKKLAYVGFKTEKSFNLALAKHRSFYGGNRISVCKYGKQPNLDEEPELKAKKEAWMRQENDLKNEETIADSGRIFIRNLPYTITEEDIETLFSPYGKIAELHLSIDKNTRKPKGFAFVTYVFPEHAVQAFASLDGTVVQGRMLHLLAGKSKPSDEGTEDSELSSYKQKKAKEQKKLASSAHNWNTLFLGANAVAELMAERYSTTKQQVLLDDGNAKQNQSIAVRMALGETQIVAETKQFLEENGIHLDAFQSAPTQRSKTVILVKNLDAQVNVEEIRELFSPFGELGRVLLPPRGVTAVVEFLEPTEAKVAFRNLAYSKFRHIPLYLEWAPVNVFKTENPKRSAHQVSSKPVEKESIENNKDENVVSTQQVSTTPENGEQPESETTIFIKNLNFSTTDETLRKHFEGCGKIFSATVARKKDPKNPGQFLSMGYGFVQFWTKKATLTALKELQNSSLDNHNVELKRSNRAENTNETIATARKTSKVGEPISSKLLVRNIAFEATTKEVAELFKPFGELKAVRLPKKHAGSESHRGFAFVDYLTKQDAKRAFESLSASTHLYGRRLVLEWAADEETVEDVRRRTVSHFTEGPRSKKSKTVDLSSGLDAE